MKIIIAGGTGFIGQALVAHFLEKNFQCVVIGRDKEKIHKIFANKVIPLTWEELDENNLLHQIKTSNAIINLAGANISAKRWSESFKQEILQSRLQTTNKLAEICASLGKNSPVLFNASAVSVYGPQTPVPNGLPPPLDEHEPIDFSAAPNFLAKVAREWELATQTAKTAGVRVVNMRFGIVLASHGGILGKLKMPFYLFLGGTMGSGEQPISWIALPDLINALDFLLKEETLSGPINFVAPECVTQKEFAQTLGEVLNRPAITPTPESLIKLILGKEMAEQLLLEGQHAVPRVLQENTFEFKYPTLKAALTALLKTDEKQ